MLSISLAASEAKRSQNRFMLTLTLTSLSCFYVKKTLFDGDLVTAVAVVAGSATAAAADQRQLARDVCE